MICSIFFLETECVCQINLHIKQDPIDLDWIDLVNKGKNPDIRLYFYLEDNK